MCLIILMYKIDLSWVREGKSNCNAKQLFTHIQFWSIASCPRFLRSIATRRTPSPLPRSPTVSSCLFNANRPGCAAGVLQSPWFCVEVCFGGRELERPQGPGTLKEERMSVVLQEGSGCFLRALHSARAALHPGLCLYNDQLDYLLKASDSLQVVCRSMVRGWAGKESQTRL